MIQPTLGSYMEKRSGLVGSLRKEETTIKSKALAPRVAKGREQELQPKEGSKGSFGELSLDLDTDTDSWPQGQVSGERREGFRKL